MRLKNLGPVGMIFHGFRIAFGVGEHSPLGIHDSDAGLRPRRRLLGPVLEASWINVSNLAFQNVCLGREPVLHALRLPFRDAGCKYRQSQRMR